MLGTAAAGARWGAALVAARRAAPEGRALRAVRPARWEGELTTTGGSCDALAAGGSLGRAVCAMAW
ncbi:MAG: hypothetical protein ABW151_05375, partial [Pseudorhodoplanes sp.]